MNSPRPRLSPSSLIPNNALPSISASEAGIPMNNVLNGLAPRRALQRAKSAIAAKDRSKGPNGSAEEDWELRHGWDAQYSSDDYLKLLTSNFYMYYQDKRHETNGNPKDPSQTYQLKEWRMKDRLKTVSAVLAVCLNIGVDPPDIVKPNPCAKLECWIDPTNADGPPASPNLNSIGKALQTQYESLSMRTKYKVLMDPTVDECKKYCATLRKNNREERILFHYNGHGVPRPTPSGEIWVFNKNYTQYIPISLHDLQSWLGAPCLFVYDCAEAALIVNAFHKHAEKHELENQEARSINPETSIVNYGDCIHLAACKEKELLPTNPELPADVFTSCLTTPIEMAIRFFILQNPLQSKILPKDAAKIPGKATERRTPMGELHWIFTAVTDTIAWNTLPKHLFKKLFRQDLMVAALFRNFLLAQRIMRVYHCHPQCYPAIPESHDNILWRSWDLAVETILAQLPQLIDSEKDGVEYEFQHSNFFSEQLTAFEIYLNQGGVERKIPEQLPVVLQVLLSQLHRLRALILLSKFLDLGPWAVNLALEIGIFPYVLKLLQSQAQELKPVMVFIWARLLAVDQSCQTDLLKDNGYQYFINLLHPTIIIPIPNVGDHKAMCAFILSMFCKDYPQGKMVTLSQEVVESCLTHLEDGDTPLLRQWACLCLSTLWTDNPEAKWTGIRVNAQEKLCDLVLDPVPEVRAAMLHAVTNFLGIPDLTDQVAHIEISMASNVLVMTSDGSGMVRKELVIFFSALVSRYLNRFIVAAYEQMVEERDELIGQVEGHDVSRLSESWQSKNASYSTDEYISNAHQSISENTVFSLVWEHVLILSVDPHPEVARDASTVVDYVVNALLQTALGAETHAVMDDILEYNKQPVLPRVAPLDGAFKRSQTPPGSEDPSPTKQNGYLAAGIKRTASVAASLKNLAFGGHQMPEKLSSLSQATRSHSTAPTPRPCGSQRSRVPAEWNRTSGESDPYQRTPGRQSLKIPSTRTFTKRDMQQAPLIPLKSSFYEFCVEYFREPQMRPSEADEPGSNEYNERLWRRNRNDRIIQETQPEKDYAGSTSWNHDAGFFSNGHQPTKLCFHQFENHIAAADDHQTISIWDWRERTRLSRFSNGSASKSRIDDIKFINEDDQASLMTGSSDGVLRIFRNYESERKVELCSAFRALTDLIPSNKNAGLVFEWIQSRGMTLVAGDVRVIRVWNAGTEICTNDIAARSGSCVTSLTTDQVEGNVFVAGFGDGAVRVYDQRLRSSEAMVRVWKEHKQWITNVHMQRGGMRELVSGSRGGEVKLWDIRMDDSITTVKATSDTLRTLSVHEHAPVFLVGTEHHRVKVFNNSGALLSNCQPYTSYLNPTRSSPIAATAFHPHRMMLACSALGDNQISMFECLEPTPSASSFDAM